MGDITADEPKYNCIDHWIFINKNDHTGIKEYDKVIVKMPTPNLLPGNTFVKFWLTWHDSKIELGKFEESEPIFSRKIEKNNLKYVMFSGCNQRNSIQWKYMLPPNIERPVLKPIKGGKPYWVPYDGLLPYGALIGGYENEFLYIMRAPHEGSLTPGKFVPSMRCGFVSWGGDMHLKTDFEILCAHDCIWVPTVEDIIPAGAIAAGYTEYAGTEIMYIGRAKREEHIIPGKVAPSYKVCFFAYNDEETSETDYEILVAPHSSPRCSNTTTKCVDSECGNAEEEEEESDYDENDIDEQDWFD